MVPRAVCGDFFSGLIYPGGVLQLNVALSWGMRTNGRTAQTIEYHNWTEVFRTLPLIEMDELAGRSLDFWKDWIEHPTYDDYWKALSVKERYEDVKVPVLQMTGWYDIFPAGVFNNFLGMREKGGSEVDAGTTSAEAAADAERDQDAVSLRQRAWPLMQMIERSQAENREITWGV